jgi:hypothetical protein
MLILLQPMLKYIMPLPIDQGKMVNPFSISLQNLVYGVLAVEVLTMASTTRDPSVKTSWLFFGGR